MKNIEQLEWADIGPIVERENIFLSPVMDGWVASSINDDEQFKAETAIEAVALYYLNMKCEQQGERQ
jgi:hypothetical protein